MPRLRLGVVLVVPSPVADRVDGLRAAFGDPARAQVMPHITLVPPVNVNQRDLPAALAVVRAAAGRSQPLDLRLGPIRVFPGPEHVAFLAVDGPPGELDRLRSLRAGVFRAPLERPLDHDFVPHVTVTQGIDAGRLASVLDATADVEPVAVRIGRVHVLHEQHRPAGRVWAPIADVALRRPVLVGRGGLPVELTASETTDPEVLAATAARGPSTLELGPPTATRALVVAARRESRVVGVAWGWTAGPYGELVAQWAESPDVGRHLGAEWDSAAAGRGAVRT
jgi:2'-5' RNA ligase